MEMIPQKELRNNVGEVLRRAEAGEELIVTVAGRPVARMGPVRPRQWVGGRDLQRVWHSAAAVTLADDLTAFPAALADPFGP